MMSIQITAEQIAALKPYMPTLDSLLAAGDIDEFETELDGAILDYGIGFDDEPTKLGLKLQKLYDEIYAQNSHRK